MSFTPSATLPGAFNCSMPDAVLEEPEGLLAVTVTVAVAKIIILGQLQMPFAGHAHAPLVRVAVYVPGVVYVCETVAIRLQLEQTGTKATVPVAPSPKFTEFPAVVPCGAVSTNCTVSGARPEDGVAEKFSVPCVVPPPPEPPKPEVHEREKYARESGPKIPLPLTPTATTPPFACHRATADCVKGPKYPVGVTLKYPWAFRYAWSSVTSLPVAPTESECPNTGHIGPLTAAMGLTTTPVATPSAAFAAAEKAINEAVAIAAIELMRRNFLII